MQKAALRTRLGAASNMKFFWRLEAREGSFGERSTLVRVGRGGLVLWWRRNVGSGAEYQTN